MTIVSTTFVSSIPVNRENCFTAHSLISCIRCTYCTCSVMCDAPAICFCNTVLLFTTSSRGHYTSRHRLPPLSLRDGRVRPSKQNVLHRSCFLHYQCQGNSRTETIPLPSIIMGHYKPISRGNPADTGRAKNNLLRHNGIPGMSPYMYLQRNT